MAVGNDIRQHTVGADGKARLGLFLGPLVLVAMLLAPAPAAMEPLAWRTAAVAALMAIWWITEAVPIPATALLPLALFPLLGISSIGASASPYANPIIFLFMGGFLLAQGMQRWELHRRLALTIIAALGARPINLIGGFMLAAAFLSMWVSNTATAVMMLPIGASVIDRVLHSQGLSAQDPAGRNFAVALMLGIAYACSIGGMGTLIGTPPNALLAAFLSDNYGYTIGFGQWMLLGVPLVALGLPLAWLLLTRWVYPVRLPPAPGGASAIQEELQQMGPMARGEWLVAVVFSATALAWITRPLLQAWLPELSDAGIAIIGALLLFLLPVNWRRGEFVLNWDWAKRIPWEVLILFGGGLALADAISSTGLAGWIGNSLSATALLPTIVIVLAVVTLIVFLTELTSNTAVTAAFLPVLAALAIGIGQSPVLLAVPAALGASCAFMMPVATPPNAIVYGSGYLTIPQMARAGFWLNLLFIGLITTAGYGLVIWVFGIVGG